MSYLNTEGTKTIHPLVHMEAAEGTTKPPGQYVVICRECGDVTRQESGWMVESGTLQQAGLYANRHLSRHLMELSIEIAKFNR